MYAVALHAPDSGAIHSLAVCKHGLPLERYGASGHGVRVTRLSALNSQAPAGSGTELLYCYQWLVVVRLLYGARGVRAAVQNRAFGGRHWL